MSYVTLAIESSTRSASVALLRGSSVICERGVMMSADSEDMLMPAVAACCESVSVAPRDIGRIVCGSGPGGFTGLRLGAALAKGLAAATGAAVFAVPSLALVVAGGQYADAPGIYLAAADALRGDVFVQRISVSTSLGVTVDGPAALASGSALEELAASFGARLVGPFIRPAEAPHARGVARLLEKTLAAGPVELDSWEPDYGRVAEAQVRWEKQHGRPLAARR